MTRQRCGRWDHQNFRTTLAGRRSLAAPAEKMTYNVDFDERDWSREGLFICVSGSHGADKSWKVIRLLRVRTMTPATLLIAYLKSMMMESAWHWPTSGAWYDTIDGTCSVDWVVVLNLTEALWLHSYVYLRESIGRCCDLFQLSDPVWKKKKKNTCMNHKVTRRLWTMNLSIHRK